LEISARDTNTERDPWPGRCHQQGAGTGPGLSPSREILSITKLTVMENGLPGKGARFGIVVPKGAYRFSN